MVEPKPIQIADKVGDDRATARAISELLVRVGSLEGRAIAADAALETMRLRVDAYAAEVQTALSSIRAQSGRAFAAAERVRKSQAELQEAILQVRKMYVAAHA